MVAEAQHAKPLAREKGISSGIALLVGCFEVLAAVNLYSETCAMADEIHDIGTDGSLAAEARAKQATATQGGPYQPLGIGRVLSQYASSGELSRR
jgi:hypothetical protein